MIALTGELGVGKTVLARAFIRALCGIDTEVPSPTFTLLQTYDGAGGLQICHFDLYRLEAPDEALELGIDEAFADAVSLIEWPERLGGYLPQTNLSVTLLQSAGADQRQVMIKGGGDWPERLRKAGLGD